VTGNYRKVHSEEFYNLYFSPDNIRMIKSRRTRLAANVPPIGEMNKACKIVAGNPEGKRPLGRQAKVRG
jgi:hypothetical protein